MSSLLLSLPELFNSYKKWVSENPHILSDVEATVKWASYFIAGRINNSNILSELVYSLSNLLVLFHDRIITKRLGTQVNETKSRQRLKVWLTVLEYSEVFIEISSQRLWGEKGRWLVIVCLQIFKCFSRLFLHFYHHEKVVQNPPIAPLKRKTEEELNKENDHKLRFQSASFTLKHSGRVIRRVHMAPPIHARMWKPPAPPDDEDDENDGIYNHYPSLSQSLAETLYIVKPLIHLGSLFVWNRKDWRPWMLSLVSDLLSLKLYRQDYGAQHRLNRRQRLELSRRTVALLLYALRSPFYDKYSKDRIRTLLLNLSKNLPLVRIILTPLADYLPVWQDTYFYMWST